MATASHSGTFAFAYPDPMDAPGQRAAGNVQAAPIGRGLSILLMAASIVVLAAGLRAVQDIVVNLLAAAFISMIAVPLLVLLQRTLRIPRWLSLLLVVTLTIAAVLGLGYLLAQSIANVKPMLPIYQARFEELTRDLMGAFHARGLQVTPDEVVARMQDWKITDYAKEILLAAASGLQSSVLVVLVTAFILAEASTLPEKIRLAFPGMASQAGFGSVADKVRAYLAVVTQLNILMGFATYIACVVMGIEFAPLLAFLVFFLNYIPTIGAIVGGSIPVLFALVAPGQGWGSAIAMAAVQVVLGVVVGSVIQPRLLGARLGLSPLVVLLSLVVWGYLLGVIGMFFAVPLTIIVKIVLDSTDDLRWLGILLGDGRVLPRPGQLPPPQSSPSAPGGQ